MAANVFNTDITDDQIIEIKNKITELEELIAPFVVNLSDEEVKHLPKISDGTLAFAEKADGYITTDPNYNPPFINITETKKDFANFVKVRPVIEKIQGVERKLVNIGIAAGSDSFVQHLAYYNSVAQAAKQGVAGAKVIYDELAKRFPGRPKKVVTTP